MKKIEIMTKNAQGSMVLEAALLIPIFLLLLFGVIDFGYFFSQSQMAERSMSAISSAVANDPNSQELSRMVREHRDIMPLGSTHASFCAQAYRTPGEAAAGQCSGDSFNVTSPDPDAGEYYVALSSEISRKTLTGFFDSELPPIKTFNVVRVDLGIKNALDKITKELSDIRATMAENDANVNKRIDDVINDIPEPYVPGGQYQTYPSGGCRIENPVTGVCGCPVGKTPNPAGEFINGAGFGDFYCDGSEDRKSAGDCGYRAYICQ